MAGTTIVAGGLWFYLVLCHLQLFSASYVKTDALNKIPQPIDDTPSTVSWDFLVLAVQWPQSFCYEVLDLNYTGSCKVPPEVTKWTVHGLWPATFNGTDVFNCNTSYPFNETEIKDLIPDLQTHWPNLLDPETTKLWAHEWNKHGTCAFIVPELAGEHNYFSKTMQLLENFNFYSIFEGSHLEPSSSTIYKADNFSEAVKKNLSVSPVINCYTTIHRAKKTTFIVQIAVCLDKGFHPIECPVSYLNMNFKSRLSGNCGDRDLYYPTIINSWNRI